MTKHHGSMKEDRGGLGAVVGLLGGIVLGSVLMANPGEEAGASSHEAKEAAPPAGEGSARRPR